ncbi:MAG: manganese efflux pump MntP family protein [Desulfobulbus sp.]|uniref:manganese efflux pump MntP n=1 Tax=Desulfobulbus sp. TaxID=895 RepID=UPI002849FE5A|nr:manganese efflux pump MntP family protein [Desulfobulbus sp.]MDR2550275.1 manganese efflux pump MntP family protein [Desulfobulbus sp.]
MNALSTILLALSMSADAFAVAVGKGASLRHPHFTEALRTGTVFGCIETLTPIVGWALGAAASSLVATVDHWIAFGILAALGIKMLYESMEKDRPQQKPSRHTLCALALAGFGTSIDALGVGVTLAFVEANIWLTSAAIGLATFLMATLGVMIGHVVGNRVGQWAEAAGGIVLVGIGTKILLEHTGIV